MDGLVVQYTYEINVGGERRTGVCEKEGEEERRESRKTWDIVKIHVERERRDNYADN